MSALTPGLYRATVRGEANVTVFTDTITAYWLRQGLMCATPLIYVKDARPLITLDLGNGTAHYIDALLVGADVVSSSAFRADLRFLADQIEAQTKPAKIEEPGLYGVVEASLNRSRETWLHTINGWSNGYHCHPWSELIDPTLIREGLS